MAKWLGKSHFRGISDTSAISWQLKVASSRVKFISELKAFINVLLQNYLWKHKSLHLPLNHMQCQVEFLFFNDFILVSQKEKIRQER